MVYKKGLNSTKYYSYNFSYPKRAKNLIKFIIVHYTGMKNESNAINRLCDPKAKVSAHYFVKKNGKILNLVPDLYTAWHAGRSYWKNFKLLNNYSIGIEISNPGHSNGYKSFSLNQIKSIKRLLKFLIKNYKINPSNVLGHSDISPDRKKDPGEKFPWKILANKKLSKWHRLNPVYIKKYRKIILSKKEKMGFLRNLYKIGYCKIKNANEESNIKYLTLAFQRRYRPELVNGKIDKECFLITKNLLK